jgi:hypothetical protein
MATAEAPRGAAAQALPPCDLVMKGGITSGIVYPGVVLKLAHRYRFASIGGTSAGAIAAALAAAAEYGRQRDERGGMPELAASVGELTQPNLLLGLFQPTPGSRPLFELLRRTFATGLSLPRRILVAAGQAHRRAPGVALLGLLVLAGLVALAGAAAGPLPTWLAVAVAVVAGAVVVVATTLVALGRLLLRTWKALDTSNYGMCPGTRQPGGADRALLDWLHARIQACAGRTDDEPLTFRDLEEQGIGLTMMSTDLSYARPVRVPDGLDGYWYKPGDFAGYPDGIVEAMKRGSKPAGVEGYRLMPIADLPVLIGVRLSLSFPILLSAMPLHRPGGGEKPSLHLLSDGGISSNFPIHFFDAWFPGRPTFGIDLASHPGGAADDVFMPSDPRVPSPARWDSVTSLSAFIGQIKDTMQNWRDTLQSELPGYRDRVCQIRFREGQGGLHLNMDPATVALLIKRGDQAGGKILETFDERQWRQHRWVRYLTLMSQLQDNLRRVREPFGPFGPELAAGLPDVNVYREGRETEWCVAASEATAALLAFAGGWGPPPLPVDLDGLHGPLPRPTIRIVPTA